MIIGLSGYARSGKDEAAKSLELFGFKRVAFADKLREFLLALNPIVGFEHGMSVVRVKDVIDAWGWDGYKSSEYGKEMRELMQRLGTECGRQLISDTIWIDAALGDGNQAPEWRNGKWVHPSIVVTDVRFPNEFEAIKERGGFVVRITREGVGPANAHPSETALDGFDFDFVLDNNGTIAELHHRIANVALGFTL